MEQFEDKEMECKMCGDTFVWPARYSSDDMELMAKMTILKDAIEYLKEKGLRHLASEALKELDEVNALDIERGTSNSQESFDYYGYLSAPVRCSKCSVKNMKENDEIRRK